MTTTRHIPTMRQDDGYEVVALVDTDPARAAREAQRLGVPRHAAVATPEELPFLDQIDAITCGTSPLAHAAVVASALRAGKPVITEKPFTMTVQEGEDLVATATRERIPLGVVHNFQFASSVQRVMRWMAAGKIGRVSGIWAVQLSNPRRRLPEWFDDLPLGLFYDEAPHLIYLVRALAGEEPQPVSVTIHPSTQGTNTPAHIDVQMRAGTCPITMQMAFEAPLSEWHVAVLGEQALAMVDIFRDIAVLVPNDGRHLAPNVFRSSSAFSWRHWAGYVRSGTGHLRGTLRYGNDEVFRRFREAVESGRQPVGIGPEDALAVLRTQHWIAGAAAS